MRIILHGYGPAKTELTVEHEVEIHDIAVGPILWANGHALGVCARDDGFELTFVSDGGDVEASARFAIDQRSIRPLNSAARVGIIRAVDQPLLGLATTRELLAELATRMEVSQNSIKGDELGALCREAIENLDAGVLEYRTVAAHA